MATSTGGDAVSAEDALNSHQKKMQMRSEVFNKARAAHMKEFQARFTKEQQVSELLLPFFSFTTSLCVGAQCLKCVYYMYNEFND